MPVRTCEIGSSGVGPLFLCSVCAAHSQRSRGSLTALPRASTPPCSTCCAARLTPSLSGAVPLAPLLGCAQIDHDLLAPPAELEAAQHKLKRLVQRPNSCFLNVKCPSVNVIRSQQRSRATAAQAAAGSSSHLTSVGCDRCLHLFNFVCLRGDA